MLSKRNIVIILSCLVVLTASFSLFLPSSTEAFDEGTTHPALTQEIINFYNATHPDAVLGNQARTALIAGSMAEDTVPRFINHFYDPVYERGWTGDHMGIFASSTVRALTSLFLSSEKPVSSVDWLHDENLQDQYAAYGGNHTWEEGLREYAGGDATAAYQTLGQIIHVLEDAGVPDHVRNDTHAHALEFLTGDPGSPHETYAMRWTTDTIAELHLGNGAPGEQMQIPHYATPEDYVRSVAAYANKYFFSRDTINAPEYALPKITREDDQWVYGLDERGREIHLASIENAIDHQGKEERRYMLMEREEYEPIFSEYFVHVAPKIMLNGAGIIELFIKQAETVKNNPALVPARPRSPWFGMPIFSVAGAGAKIKNSLSATLASIAGFFGAGSDKTIIIPTSADNAATTSTTKEAEPASSSSVVVIAPATTAKKSTAKDTKEPSTTPAPTMPAPATPKPTAQTVGSTASTTSAAKATSTATVKPAKTTAASTTASSSPAQTASTTVPFVATTTTTPYLPSATTVTPIASTTPELFGTILVSEIQVTGKTEANDEFVEFYNPNDFAVPIGKWSFQYLTGTATSFDQMKKRNFEEGMVVEAKHYFLAARGLNSSGQDGYSGNIAPDLTQRTFSFSGAATGGAVFLVKNQELITSADDPDIVDMASYGTNVITPVRIAVPTAGKSIERKARLANQCVSATNGEGAFAGNGCDTDGADDFEIRTIAEPQNSLSLSEPRSAPAPSNFSVSYVSSSVEAVFNWDPSEHTTEEGVPSFRYRLVDLSSSGTVVIFESTSTFAYRLPLSEVGKEYLFGLEVIDQEGARRLTTASLSVPSFLSAANFYRDPRPNSTRYLADFFYGNVPFIPPRFSMAATGEPTWQAMVVYRNQSPDRNNIVLTTNNNFTPASTKGVVNLDFGTTQTQAVFAVNPNALHPFGGGLAQSSWLLPREDGHVLLTLASTTENLHLTSADYFTIAYYDFSRVGGGTQDLSLVAVDANKYYFSPSPPPQAVPTVPDELIGTRGENGDQVELHWSSSTDSDTLDNSLTYEIGYSASIAGEFSLHAFGNSLSVILTLEYAKTYTLAVRAIDDFGHVSEWRILTWETPAAPPPLPSQLEHPDVIGRATGEGQRIVFPSDETISSVTMWIENDGGNSCCAATYLELRSDNDVQPGDLLATSTIVTIGRSNGNGGQAARYDFDAVSVVKDAAYWLVPVYAGFNGTRFYGVAHEIYASGTWGGNINRDAYFEITRVH